MGPAAVHVPAEDRRHVGAGEGGEVEGVGGAVDGVHGPSIGSGPGRAGHVPAVGLPSRQRPGGRMAARPPVPAADRAGPSRGLQTVIDFTLTDEHRLVRDAARAFVEAEILPNIREWDEKGEVHREVFAKMAELGFLGAPIPERYGGAGMDYISFALLCEELERADTAFRVVQSVHVGLNSLTLLQWGTEEQRQRWLVPAGEGREAGDLRADGAGRGHGRRQPRDDRAPRRRLLRPQRAQDLDLARRPRGPLPGCSRRWTGRRGTRASRRSWWSAGCPA